MNFDKAIMQVSSFGEVKKIYAQIKELKGISPNVRYNSKSRKD